MKCMNCGCSLSEQDFCTNCGADVRIYKKIIRISNALYNDGLAKARVRDLSGALISLKQSLRFDKNNMHARNLLGLVYYEMGETVAALEEWVISKNLHQEKNIADDYIKAIQSNPNRLETINQTIKKYNQALLYCKQGSEDLAIIQLKKVLSLNPNLIQGHQLMALLYMRAGDQEKASRALKKALKIDTTNTTTMRYLLELDKTDSSVSEEEKPGKPKAKAKEGSIFYKSGNETIIQPVNFRDNSGFSTVTNILIGVAVGVALFWFLILPAKTQAVKSEVNKKLVEYSNELSTKSATITDLQSQLNTSNDKLTKAQKDLEKYTGNEGMVTKYEALISAIKARNENNSVAASEKLNSITSDNMSDDAKALYDSVKNEVSSAATGSYYDTGISAYRAEDYATAVANLSQYVKTDTSKVQVLYYLAKSYKMTGDTAKANEYYNMIIEKFPDSEYANYARSNVQ